MRPPLDIVELSRLHPELAATRLSGRWHEELVDFFTEVPAGAVAGILAAYLELDDGEQGVALLGDINQRKAGELIESLGDAGSWLARLPEASEAISRAAAGQGWTTHRRHLESRYWGYIREYQPGSIYWSQGGGTRTINAKPRIQYVDSTLSSYYRELGGGGSWLGFPTAGPVHPGGGRVYQSFEEGTLFWRSDTGAIAVRAANMELFSADPASPVPGIDHPLTPERPIGPGESDRIQFFDRCVMTVRDGKAEIWLRP